jgi:hypothetical protein
MKSNHWPGLGFLSVFCILGFLLFPTTFWAYEVGPEFMVSTPFLPLDVDKTLPSVAGNEYRSEFLVVWHEKASPYRHIVGRRVTVDGTPVGDPIDISGGTYDRIQPQANYDNYCGRGHVPRRLLHRLRGRLNERSHSLPVYLRAGLGSQLDLSSTDQALMVGTMSFDRASLFSLWTSVESCHWQSHLSPAKPES